MRVCIWFNLNDQLGGEGELKTRTLYLHREMGEEGKSMRVGNWLKLNVDMGVRGCRDGERWIGEMEFF